MGEITQRVDFVWFFDVKDGNPNGDPDNGNRPRMDLETGHGFVSPAALKRKIRDWVLQVVTKDGKPAPGKDIFVRHRAVLNQLIEEKVKAAGISLKNGKTEGEGTLLAQARLCADYYDIRAFGGVLSSGVNGGQVQGPIQLGWARSIDPVTVIEHTITRVAVTTVEESENQAGANRTMGRVYTIPYALYRVEGFVVPSRARRIPDAKVPGTGFSEEDLALLWDAIEDAFELDRASARGVMATRKLILFQHEDTGHGRGCAHAADLLESVVAQRKPGSFHPRALGDYTLTLAGEPMEWSPLRCIRRVQRSRSGSVVTSPA